MSQRRFNHNINLTIFSKGTIPFQYLGVPIFKEKVKVSYLKALKDNMVSKMAYWKGFLLSFDGKILLVKIVIQNMISHYIELYY